MGWQEAGSFMSNLDLCRRHRPAGFIAFAGRLGSETSDRDCGYITTVFPAPGTPHPPADFYSIDNIGAMKSL
jgi:hypothetical protein